MPNIPGGAGHGGLGLDDGQLHNAMVIIHLGHRMGMSKRDIQIALMVALQESSLRNLAGGMDDSAGLFQQRPSMGWGTYQQVTDPQYATRKFFNTLKGVSGRNGMKMWEAAQAVQRSANGLLYKDRHGMALAIYRNLFGDQIGDHHFHQFVNNLVPSAQQEMHDIMHPQNRPPDPAEAMGLEDLFKQNDKNQPRSPGDSDTPQFSANPHTYEIRGVKDPASPFRASRSMIAPIPPEGFDVGQHGGGQGGHGGGGGGHFGGGGFAGESWRKTVVRFAHKALGSPYIWAAEGPNAFDCSGLVLWAMAKAGINMPRVSADQARVQFGSPRKLKRLQPGDLVFWDNSSRNDGADHVAIYIGHGKIIEAPRPGLSVQISSLYDLGEAWGIHLHPRGV